MQKNRCADSGCMFWTEQQLKLKYERCNMMKRFCAMMMAIAAALCLCTAVSAAETEIPDAAAVEAFFAANTGKEVLARHENALMTRTTFFEGAEVMTENYYKDADTALWNYNDGNALLRTADCFVDLDLDSESKYGLTVFDSEKDRTDLFVQTRDLGFVSLQSSEGIVRCYETDEGLFIVETRSADPEEIGQCLEEVSYTGTYTYADGMALDYRYMFDRASSDLVRTESFVIGPGGESSPFQVETYAYDVGSYEPAGKNGLFAEYFTAEYGPEDLCTVRIVYNPDTQGEKAVEEIFPVHTRFSAIHHGAYIREFYLDRECTQLCESYEVTGDLVLYVRAD